MRATRSTRDYGFFLNSPLAAFVIDGEGCVLSWNPAAERMFGWKEAEVLRQRLPIVPPSALDEFARLRHHVLAGNRLTGFETIRQRRNGTQIAVRISAAPFRDEEDNIIGVLAMAEDLSVTRSLERSVAETTRLLFALVEASPVAIIVADAELRIRIWNAAAARMYGWTAAELVGEPLDAIASTAAGTVLLRLAKQMESAQIPGSIVRERRRDGGEFDAWPAAVVVADGEKHVATMAMVRDVSAQVEAERSALRASEELRALSLQMMYVLEEERVRIAREIHDELGQLLTGVLFDLSAIRKASPDAGETATRAGHAAAMVERAIGCVRRIAADLRPPLLDAVGLSAAIRMEVTKFQERTGIECNLSLPPDDLAPPNDVSTAIYRILQEALTNVARHASAESVDIRVRRRDGMLYLEVRDDGRGIDPARQRTGALGLVGMRERAAGIGGELRIERGQPRGTVVTVAVPFPEAP